jgi:hypothetical protein
MSVEPNLPPSPGPFEQQNEYDRDSASAKSIYEMFDYPPEMPQISPPRRRDPLLDSPPFRIEPPAAAAAIPPPEDEYGFFQQAAAEEAAAQPQAASPPRPLVDVNLLPPPNAGTTFGVPPAAIQPLPPPQPAAVFPAIGRQGDENDEEEELERGGVAPAAAPPPPPLPAAAAAKAAARAAREAAKAANAVYADKHRKIQYFHSFPFMWPVYRKGLRRVLETQTKTPSVKLRLVFDDPNNPPEPIIEYFNRLGEVFANERDEITNAIAQQRRISSLVLAMVFDEDDFANIQFNVDTVLALQVWSAQTTRKEIPVTLEETSLIWDTSLAINSMQRYGFSIFGGIPLALFLTAARSKGRSVKMVFTDKKSDPTFAVEKGIDPEIVNTRKNAEAILTKFETDWKPPLLKLIKHFDECVRLLRSTGLSEYAPGFSVPLLPYAEWQASGVKFDMNTDAALEWVKLAIQKSLKKEKKAAAEEEEEEPAVPKRPVPKLRKKAAKQRPVPAAAVPPAIPALAPAPAPALAPPPEQLKGNVIRVIRRPSDGALDFFPNEQQPSHLCMSAIEALVLELLITPARGNTPARSVARCRARPFQRLFESPTPRLIVLLQTRGGELIINPYALLPYGRGGDQTPNEYRGTSDLPASADDTTNVGFLLITLDQAAIDPREFVQNIELTTANSTKQIGLTSRLGMHVIICRDALIVPVQNISPRVYFYSLYRGLELATNRAMVRDLEQMRYATGTMVKMATADPVLSSGTAMRTWFSAQGPTLLSVQRPMPLLETSLPLFHLPASFDNAREVAQNYDLTGTLVISRFLAPGQASRIFHRPAFITEQPETVISLPVAWRSAAERLAFRQDKWLVQITKLPDDAITDLPQKLVVSINREHPLRAQANAFLRSIVFIGERADAPRRFHAQYLLETRVAAQAYDEWLATRSDYMMLPTNRVSRVFVAISNGVSQQQQPLIGVSLSCKHCGSSRNVRHLKGESVCAASACENRFLSAL